MLQVSAPPSAVRHGSPYNSHIDSPGACSTRSTRPFPRSERKLSADSNEIHRCIVAPGRLPVEARSETMSTIILGGLSKSALTPLLWLSTPVRATPARSWSPSTPSRASHFPLSSVRQRRRRAADHAQQQRGGLDFDTRQDPAVSRHDRRPRRATPSSSSRNSRSCRRPGRTAPVSSPPDGSRILSRDARAISQHLHSKLRRTASR